ncbi:hypothetical protein AB4Z52_32580 [Rhizobium sp. 2YAF20]
MKTAANCLERAGDWHKQVVPVCDHKWGKSIEVFVTIAWIADFRSINPMSLARFPQRFLHVRIGSHFMTCSTVLWMLLVIFAGALAHVILTQRREGHLAVPPIPGPEWAAKSRVQRVILTGGEASD